MKVIFFTTLLLFFVNGFAQNWKPVAKGVGGNTYYVDVDNIKKHNGLIYYWVLLELLEPLDNGANSVLTKYKVDCVETKLTHLSVRSFSLPMGKGNIVYESSPNQIEYPKSGTHSHFMMKSVCDYVMKYM